MKEITARELVVGTTAMMKVGSPVRQWLRVVRRGAETMADALEVLAATAFIAERQVAAIRGSGHRRLMLPYAIVYHHDGRDWVKLWVDTRKVTLYEPE